MKKKIIIISIVLFFICLLVNVSLYFMNINKVTVLGYHAILPSQLNNYNNEFFMDLEKFEKQISLLDSLGYKTMTLDDFYCWKEGECKKKRKSILITLDDGYMNNYDYVFDVLKKHNMNCVVFVVGEYADNSYDNYMDIETLNKIKKNYSNVEIASHTYGLHEIYDNSYDDIVSDIKKMKKIVKSKYFAYPHGEYNEEYVRALKDNGYKMAFTFGPGKEHRKADISDDVYAVPRLNISAFMPMYKFLLRIILPI